MKAIRTLAAALSALSLAAPGVFAEDKKPAGSAGATAEKSRTAGGVSEELLKEFRALDANKDGFVAKQEVSSKADLAKNFGKPTTTATASSIPPSTRC